MTKLYASIDIGTNSALLLIASLEGDGKDATLRPRLQKVAYPRVGKGLGESGRIADPSRNLLMAALSEFRQTYRRVGAVLSGVALTQAFRKAENGPEILREVEEFLGVPCEIITGERESQLAYLAVKHRYPQENLCVLDIGGGSTEISTDALALSVPVGAVGLYEKNGYYPEPNNRKQAREALAEGLGIDLTPTRKRKPEPPPASPHFAQPPLVVAVGGTATTLAMMEKQMRTFEVDAIEGFEMETAAVNRRVLQMADLGKDMREQLPGLDPARADIIVPGLCILEVFLELAKVERFLVSDQGLRYGLIWEALEKKNRR